MRIVSDIQVETAISLIPETQYNLNLYLNYKTSGEFCQGRKVAENLSSEISDTRTPISI